MIIVLYGMYCCLFYTSFKKNSQVFRMSFERKNLAYIGRPTENKQEELLHSLNSVPGCAIVYTRNRKRKREIAELLVNNAITATFYHAGLNNDVKDQRDVYKRQLVIWGR